MYHRADVVHAKGVAPRRPRRRQANAEHPQDGDFELGQIFRLVHGFRVREGAGCWPLGCRLSAVGEMVARTKAAPVAMTGAASVGAREAPYGLGGYGLDDDVALADEDVGVRADLDVA